MKININITSGPIYKLVLTSLFPIPFLWHFMTDDSPVPIYAVLGVFGVCGYFFIYFSRFSSMSYDGARFKSNYRGKSIIFTSDDIKAVEPLYWHRRGLIEIEHHPDGVVIKLRNGKDIRIILPMWLKADVKDRDTLIEAIQNQYLYRKNYGNNDDLNVAAIREIDGKYHIGTRSFETRKNAEDYIYHLKSMRSQFISSEQARRNLFVAGVVVAVIILGLFIIKKM